MPFVECYSKPLSDDAIITEEEAVRIREMTKHDNNLKESNPKPAPKRGSSFDAIYKATMGTNTATTPLAPGSTPWTNVVRTPTVSTTKAGGRSSTKLSRIQPPVPRTLVGDVNSAFAARSEPMPG